MVECKEIDLVPIGIKKQIRMIKRVATCAEVCVITLLVVMWLAGGFRDWITGGIFSLILLLITTPLLIPGYMFDKVSQSTVRLAADYIHIVDKKGECWRSIDCKTITAVRVEEISGFFHGGNQDMFRNKYVCIFLNGVTDIPNVHYKNLFTEKDFVMFGYYPEVLQWILQNYLHI